MMGIIWLECKKALTSPIILALLMLFSAWNVYVIVNSSHFKEELGVVQGLIKENGIAFTEETLEELRHGLKPEQARLNKITKEKTEQTYRQAAEFFESLKIDDQALYTEAELDTFYKLYLKEMYLNVAESVDDAYEAINIEKVGEQDIKNFGLTEAAADTLRKEYVRLANRFHELQDNGEHQQWFFYGKEYAMHSLLFGTVFRHIVIEALILIVLATALISNYEFENRTQLITYSTMRGRKLMLDKLFGSFIAASVLTVCLLLVTLGTYFAVFDYSGIWASAISSGFNWEYNFPYVSWWNISFSMYLLLGIMILFISMLMFVVFTFCISALLKNSYVTFIVFAVLFICFYILQGFMPGSSNLIFITGFNLSSLILNLNQWGMGSSGLTMFKYYELGTIVAWIIILTISCVLSLKKFVKQDIS